MNVPPAIFDLRIARAERGPVHVWLPFFLLWPVVLVFGVLVLVFAILADAVLLVLGARYHRYTVFLARFLVALCDTRGTVLRFSDGKTAVDMTVL